jgi:LysW-gamma-L-lysine carboxypeptidase
MSALGYAANTRQSALYVVKLGSATLAHESVFDELAVLRGRGARLLVVAGGAAGIQRHYADIDRPIRTLVLGNGDQVRYCPPDEMPHIVAAYQSITLRRVADAVAARGLTAFTSVASAGALVTGRANPPLKIVADGRRRVVRDHRAGRVAEVAADRLRALLEAFDVVCVSPPVADREGGAPLNVDADVLAAELANALDADHLRLVTGTPGLLKDPADPTDRVADAVAGQAGGYAEGRMRQKVRAAEIALTGAADVAITGPHALSPASGTRFWRAPAPAPDLDLLARASEISSVSGDERELAEYLVDWCTRHGIHAGIDEAGNLVAVKGSGDRRLLLLGHLDTVPHRWPARWDGDTLHARGSVDAKGCLVAYLQTLAGLEVPDGHQVRVVGAVEEEITARGAFHVRDNYPADAVIVGEPSGSAALTVGYYGLLKVRLTISHPVGHTAGQGVSTAADRLHGILAAIRERIGAIAPDAMPAVLGVHAMNDGDRQRGEAVLDVRVPPDCSLTDLTDAVRHLAADADPQILRATPGVTTPRSNVLVKAFSRAFREREIAPRFLAKKGSSDMNTLATTWHGVPMVAYGPGDAALDHTPHEHLSAGEFRTARSILEVAVRNWLTVRVPEAVR